MNIDAWLGKVHMPGDQAASYTVASFAKASKAGVVGRLCPYSDMRSARTVSHRTNTTFIRGASAWTTLGGSTVGSDPAVPDSVSPQPANSDNVNIKACIHPCISDALRGVAPRGQPQKMHGQPGPASFWVNPGP